MRVYWFLFGGRTTGSSRIHGLNLHEQFLKAGIESRLVIAPPERLEFRDLPCEPDLILHAIDAVPGGVAVFETIAGARCIELVRSLQRRGVICVFSECDLNYNYEFAALCDHVVCTSQFLAAKYHDHVPDRVSYIPDAVELMADRPPSRGRTGLITLGWIGNGKKWGTLDVVRRVLERSEFRDYRLLTISNHPEADVRWTVDGALPALATCDVAVIPTECSDYDMAKSNNRVTQSMALGLPVIASRIPAYAEIIEGEDVGFLCTTGGDWENALRQLRDPDVRCRFAMNAWQTARDSFSIDVIATRWESLFLRLSTTTPAPEPSSFRQSHNAEARLDAELSMAFSEAFESRENRREAVRWALKASWSQMRSGSSPTALFRILRNLRLRDVGSGTAKRFLGKARR